VQGVSDRAASTFERMELVGYSDEDLALTVALESDPEVMRELGGPTPKEEIPAIHRRRVATAANEVDWWLKIVPEPGGPAAGTIGVWESRPAGEPIHETGWMVLPEFQGRGIASAALALLLEQARAEPRLRHIHAFPAVTNGPSNALCRKFGFELNGEREFEFRGQTLRCNHWELDVSA
jgi:RimJ/RimL family protein N-acetyltransferase